MIKNLVNATKIKQFRREMGLSQSRLARKVGLRSTTISRIEREGSASEETVFKLAQFFDCTVADLEAFPNNAILPEARKIQAIMPIPSKSREIKEIEDFMEEYPDGIKCLYNMTRILKALNDRPWEKHAIMEMLKAFNDRLYATITENQK